MQEENIFINKQSGKDFKKPVYQEMLSIIEQEDMILFKSIDRFGRNYFEILE